MTEKSSMTPLLSTAKAIYRKIPSCFQFIFLPAKSVIRFIDILRQDVWLIKGKEAKGKHDLVVLFAGSEENKNFLNSLLFDSFCQENYVGKKWLWNICKTVERNSDECSLMITQLPKKLRAFFRSESSFFIPYWIVGEVNISADISFFLRNKSLASDLRRIRKNNLNFELTNELSQFNNFYYNMYIPHITKVHGNGVVLMEYDFMEREFKNCDLLLVKNEKDYIAGILLAYKKQEVRLWSLGVKDGNSDYVRDGAIGALFYFAVNYLQEKGYKTVNFGASRAFLRDGVLKYKKKWGLKIVGTFKKGFLVTPLSKTKGLKEFLLNNPFIYMDKCGFNSAVFIENPEALSKKDMEKLYKDYYLTGVSKLFIYRFGEGNIKRQEIVPQELSDRMTIHSAESFLKNSLG
jgi:hypothetical protein